MGAVNYLLDTHTLLWWLFDAPELSAKARGIISEPSHAVYVSSASAWEISTKFRLGKIRSVAPMVSDMSGWLARAGMKELPIGVVHAQRAGGFLQPHKDPFDRMLAAQALTENMPLLTTDAALAAFGVSCIW